MLLSNKRAKKSSIPDRSIAIESESDRARLVFSAPFRRLQQKAQVFSLESNAAVRSRLTHSLEVAQLGRFLSDQIIEKLIAQGLITEAQSRAFINFVEVACLMHDLGNPPFGHFGEAAISQWFNKNGEACLEKAISQSSSEDTKCFNQLLADFIEFDGNCQGLRIASLLQYNDDEYGLNLTFSSLASYLKYIRSSLYDSTKVNKQLFKKKAGYFSTEIDLVNAIWTHFQYKTDSPQRFPLAYVMEAADDIAYCISDVEDSIEKKLLDSNNVFKQLKNDWKEAIKDLEFDSDLNEIDLILEKASTSTGSSSSIFTVFRTSLTRLLTKQACETYCNKHESILNGTCTGLIDDKCAGGIILGVLRNFCKMRVYRHASVQQIELAGFTAISGLLDSFKVLLECPLQRFNCALAYENKDLEKKTIIIETKLLSLFPEKHIKAYKYSCEKINANKNLNNFQKLQAEWNLRAHLITDFISGMTDDFALATFQMLSGIKVN